MSRYSGLEGETYGRWYVLGMASRGVDGRERFECVCSCGNSKAVTCKNVLAGISLNCGCVRNLKTVARNTTHGKTHSPEYLAWLNMRMRCTYPKNIGYKNYGARGISFCSSWRDFQTFLSDMGCRPTSKHSLERVDNEKNYNKTNCKWATKAEQSNNKRTNVMVFFREISMSLKQASLASGIGYSALQNRLKRGWPIENLFSPLMRQGSKALTLNK